MYVCICNCLRFGYVRVGVCMLLYALWDCVWAYLCLPVSMCLYVCVCVCTCFVLFLLHFRRNRCHRCDLCLRGECINVFFRIAQYTLSWVWHFVWVYNRTVLIQYNRYARMNMFFGISIIMFINFALLLALACSTVPTHIRRCGAGARVCVCELVLCLCAWNAV